ncbi:hypothetical protein B0H14DRAFT_3681514 [Mycena olivaceomarginata]|nr:hypothetical protein B0H14DRAFT_3681514 [Mycena olivaceomarginata]
MILAPPRHRLTFFDSPAHFPSRALIVTAASMDAAAVPGPKGPHGGKRAGCGRKKKEETLGNSVQTPANPRHALLARTQRATLHTAPLASTPQTPAAFFNPYTTNQPVLSNSTQTGRASFWSDLGPPRPVTGENISQGFTAETATRSHISPAEFAQVNQELNYVDENDEHADIASGDRIINDSLVDAVLETTETNSATAEAETGASEAGIDSVLQKQFAILKDRLSKEIKKYGSPLCYRQGDFYDRPMHAIFALHRSMGSNHGLDPSELYARDVFIWIPNLLPGAPDRFKCTCGKPLSRNGFNDDPIARRVRSIPNDFFLLTNRFHCNPRRNDPGCGTSYQGTDPHVIAQLPSFVQPAFPGILYFCSGRDFENNDVANVQHLRIRFGPAPFSEMVSEIQHRHHADGELMYLGAVNFYAQRGCKSYSKFDDPQEYAGIPPSIPYLKALFTDFISAIRIYIERDIATLPLTVAKADHTFDFLKHMGGMKGQRIFTAAYTVVNEFEEDMLEGIQDGLRNSKNPPTEIIYTDLPQAERSFHESINSSLTRNVVPIHDWTDLPCFERSPETPTIIASDSIDIEEAASDLLEDFTAVPLPSSQLHLVVLAVKTEQLPGQSPRLDIIQLRTKNKIHIFKVTDLTSRSDVLPSLRAILTNPSIIKIGHSIRPALQIISQVFSLKEIDNILKARTAPILDLGKYAKLKGVLEDTSASLPALAGIILKKLFSPPLFSPYPWSSSTTLSQNDYLFSEVDCQWQIFLSLLSRNSLGLPLQPIQAQTHGQLVSLDLGCQPIAEGSIVAQHIGFLDAVMDGQGHTKRINVSSSRSLIRVSKVLVPGALHALHGQTMEWIFNHGAYAVVTTSQLHTRGETPPIPSATLSRAFAVPAAPPSLEDDTELPLHMNLQLHNPRIHLNSSIELEDGRYGPVVPEIGPNSDAMQGIESDLLDPNGDANVSQLAAH